MTALTTQKASDIIEAVIAKGDISQLTKEERAKYYVRVCESLGLNPMTRPFEYIVLNNKLTLYARKDATDQLRSIHQVSIVDLAESERDGIFIVTAKVTNGSGRTDMAKGAVSIEGLRGELLANAMMKAESKAKRRATLSICGLGFIDESELPASAVAQRLAPQNRPRLAAQLAALGEEVPEEDHTDNPGAFYDALDDPFPPDDTLEERELDRPGPYEKGQPDSIRADPNFEQGRKDARAGMRACLNREIATDKRRHEQWKSGFEFEHAHALKEKERNP